MLVDFVVASDSNRRDRATFVRSTRDNRENLIYQQQAVESDREGERARVSNASNALAVNILRIR